MTRVEEGWAARLEDRLRDLEQEGRWRRPRVFDARGPAGTLAPDGVHRPTGGDAVVSFASNDYLGLSGHPRVVAAAHEALDRWGAGSGASRLITGSRPVHDRLERDLAEWKGTESAVCFPTGFAANLGVLTALGVAGTRIYSDALNHASIVDGCRLARAPVSIYRHADPSHLAELMATHPEAPIVVSDAVFSMDGDLAPEEDLMALCRAHGGLLVLDEAHAVLGRRPGAAVGSGTGAPPTPETDPGTGLQTGALAPEVPDAPVVPEAPDVPVVRVGTLSKTLGSLGGFVAGPMAVSRLLVNVARPYIFTTALSPADAAAARAALAIVRSDEGTALRARLAAYVDAVAPGHGAPIVPVVLGSEARAVAASAALLEQGLWVPAIRPPTVPVGTSRLRVTLSAAHRPEQVTMLCSALARLGAPVAGATSEPR